jgi:flagellar protein FliS
MNQGSAANAYLEGALETAPPIKIVRLLYQGALRFLDRALAADPGDPGSEFVELVSRADAVIYELRLSLDAERAPEVAGPLCELYLFIEAQLQRAMTERDPAPLRAARSVLATLYEAWAKVEVPAGAGA